jgi:hypothetical protein
MEEHTEYVEQVAAIARNHSDWEYQGGDESYRREIQRSNPQLRFNHSDTEGLLSIEFPANRPAYAWVNQALDNQLYGVLDDDVEGGFLHDLERAYQQFSEEHSTQYLADQGEPGYEVARALFPLDYEDIEINMVLDSMSEISRDVENLHEAVRQPVRDALN